MRYFVESTKRSPKSNSKPLGSYVEVVSAVHQLFPKRKWHTARKGIGFATTGEVEIFLTTRRNKNLPESLAKMIFPLMNAGVPSDLWLDISHAMVIPDELINLVILNNADRLIGDIVVWAKQRGWQVREWPDGPALSENEPNQPLQPTSLTRRG